MCNFRQICSHILLVFGDSVGEKLDLWAGV